MSVINIKSLAKALESSPKSRKLFSDAVQIVLFALEGQKLIDSRMMQKTSLDWDRGTLNLGNNLVNQLIGRSIGEYYMNRKIKAALWALRKDQELKDS